MRLKRFLAALLSVALAAPPGAFAQSHAGASVALNVRPAESPLVSGPSDAYADPVVPPDIAHGVFGVYGGAQPARPGWARRPARGGCWGCGGARRTACRAAPV